MSAHSNQAREDQFLGALLGLAIGDALGRPVAGMSAGEIASRFGTVDTYVTPPGEDEEAVQGEITGITEIALCIVESITTNSGMIDPENINVRLSYLLHGPSRRWMSDVTVQGIEQAGEGDGLVASRPAPGTEPEPELAVALRGVPIGLLHAVGGFDAEAMARDAALAARLSHGDATSAASVAEVAGLVNAAARERVIPEHFPASGAGRVPAVVREVVALTRRATTFEAGVAAVIGRGGATNEEGALAGALLGAAGGASGIPQHLIDGLDARIYLSLAAPWFYRAAQRRAGTVIDLRTIS